MDPLSISASIAGLITITDIIAGKSYKYIKEARGASKEAKKLLGEITDLFGILNSLRLVAARYEDEAFKSTMQTQHIHSCHVLLEKIKDRLDRADPSQANNEQTSLRRKTSSWGRSLAWPFTVSETKALIDEVANHKSTMTLALAADGMTALIQALGQQKAQGDDITEIRDNLRAQRAEQALSLLSRKRRVILDSLGTYDHIRSQENSIKLRQPGTGVWFTEGFHFTRWLATKNARLWLYGIPGAGKTILTSSIIQATINQSDQGSGIAYFYCDYREPKTHDPKMILGSLARQLAIQDPRCMTELEAFYKRNCPDTGVPPSFTSEALCLLLKSFSPFFEEIVIIIDALDECGTDRSHVVEILTSLHDNGAFNIKTLFTSRWETDIEVHLVDYEKVSIAATGSDLKLYVASEIEKRSRKKILRMRDPELKIEIMERLVEGAEGMFRWVACQLDYLSELNTDKALRRALHSLPPTLPETYERILDRVNASNGDTQELVKRVLIWIVCSKRPLSTKELLEAVSISLGDSTLDREAVPDEQGILRWCSSLIRRAPDGERLELAHFTVEEFLRNINVRDLNSKYAKYGLSGSDHELVLAKLCLTYLNFDDFGGEFWSEEDELDQFAKDHPFFGYACYHWNNHALGFYDHPELLQLMHVLFDPSKNGNFVHWSQYWTWLDVCNYSITLTCNTETLHFAAGLSLYSICEWLINEKARRDDLNKLSNLGTPIYCAIAGSAYFAEENIPFMDSDDVADKEDHAQAETDRRRTLECLLDAGAAMDYVKVHPDHDLSPLALALRLNFGWDVLLKRGAKLDETCLGVAESRTHSGSKIVERFLLAVTDQNLSDNIRPRYVEAALMLEKTREQAVKMMSKSYDGSQRSLTVNGTSTLRKAAMIGQIKVVKGLLAQPDIDLDFRDMEAGGNTALHDACENGHLDIIKLLLDHGATIDILNNDDETPFHLAASAKDLHVVKFLENQGADINRTTSSQLTSLHLAAQGNNVAILEHILGSPRNTHTLSQKARNGQTALLYAVEQGSVDSTKFILENTDPSEILLITVDGHTCLHYAAKTGNPEMMYLFHSSGISHLARTTEGLTALHFAVQGDDADLLEELLDQIDESTSKTMDPFTQEVIVQDSACYQNWQGAWCVDGWDSPSGLNIASWSGKTALQYLISADYFTSETLAMFNVLANSTGIDLECRDQENNTPLAALARRLADTDEGDEGDEEYNLNTAIEHLLNRGVDVNAQNSAGRTALHYLCRPRVFSHYILDAIAKLIYVKPRGASLNMRSPFLVPPHHESQASTVLLENGIARLEDLAIARVDIEDKSKESAIQAFVKGLQEMRDELQYEGTNIALQLIGLTTTDHLNSQHPDGDRTLNLVIIANNDKIIKELRRRGVSIQNRDHTSERRSPLELFAIHGTRDTGLLRCFIHDCKNISELDVDGSSLLHLACENRHLNVVQELLDAGINVNIEDIYLKTPFSEAVARSDVSIVELLLEHNASLKVRQPEEVIWSSFLLNCVSNIDICRLLDGRGANNWAERTSRSFFTKFIPGFSKELSDARYGTWRSVRIHQLTPLHHQAIAGRLEVFKYVFEYIPNADFNVEANFGLTPLFFAIMSQNIDLVQFLCSHGGRTDAVCTLNGWSILHFAAVLGESSMVAQLLSHGANACARDTSNLTPALLALQNQSLQVAKVLEESEKSQFERRYPIEAKTISSRLEESETKFISPALTDAVVRGDLVLCEKLVDRGFDIIGVCECGCSPLISACANQQWEVAKYLLSIGASIEGITCARKKITTGLSAFQYAACSGEVELLRTILDNNGSVIDEQSSIQAIHLATYHGDLKMVQLLLDHTRDHRLLLQARAGGGAVGFVNLIAKEKDIWRLGERVWGAFPLMIASTMGHIDVVELFIRAGADLEARDEAGRTALQYSIQGRLSTDTFELLIGAGANINTRDNCGLTPFMRAAGQGLTNFLTKMVTYNQMDRFAQDQSGSTALFHSFNAPGKNTPHLLVDMGLEASIADYGGMSAIQGALLRDNEPFALEKLPMVDTIRSPINGSILTTAAYCGPEEVVKELLKRVPTTDLQNYLNFPCKIGTPLYLSAIRGNAQITRQLLDKGAEINFVGGPWGTPLMAACAMGRLEVVRMLLLEGAALQCERRDGTMITAEEAAKQHDQVLLLLEMYRANGKEALNNELPVKKANIKGMEEVLRALKERKSAAEPTQESVEVSAAEESSSPENAAG